MPTLTTTEILTLTLDSFKQRVPELAMLTLDSSASQMKLGQSAIAHIRSVPTVGDYDEDAGGYFNDSVEGRSLLTDVEVTMDAHKHVTLSLSHLNALGDQKIDMETGDAAYALGKHIVDSVLAKAAAAANVTQVTTATIANTDKSVLGSVRKAMNQRGALTNLRYGLVNSDFAEALSEDPRIESRDFAGRQIEGDALFELLGVSGFSRIREYPGLPTTGNLTALFFDPRLMVVKTALPNDSSEFAAQMGIPNIASVEIVQDPETGLALMGIKHMEPGTLKAFITLTLLFGSSVGAQGGSAGARTDYAGHRVRSATPA
jgi:hypothetical protein